MSKNWQPLLNTACTFRFIGNDIEQPFCPVDCYLPLVPNEYVREKSANPISFRKFIGKLSFQPVFAAFQDATAEGIRAELSRWLMSLRVGLVRQTVTQATDDVQALNLHDDRDFADGKWIRVWDKIWQPETGIHVANGTAGDSSIVLDGQYRGAYVGLCSDFTSTNGTGLTVCQPFGIPLDCDDLNNNALQTCGEFELNGAIQGVTSGQNVGRWVNDPRTWTINFRYNRPIKLRENDQLGLWISMASPLEPSQVEEDYCFANVPDVIPFVNITTGLRWLGHIRAIEEVGR